jgi:hypothetical protein
MSGWRHVLAVISPRLREPTACEACGAEFTCGATLGGCWCREVKVPAEARASLRERYSKCLCRACLERAAETTQGSPAKDPENERAG